MCESKLADRSQGQPEGFLLNSYYTNLRGRRFFFSWMAPLTIDPYILMLSIKYAVIKYHF